MADGDDARGGVAGEAGMPNRWKAVKETRTARASAAPNTQAASKKEEERFLIHFKAQETETKKKNIYIEFGVLCFEHKGAAEYNECDAHMLPQISHTHRRWADRVVLLAAENH